MRDTINSIFESEITTLTNNEIEQISGSALPAAWAIGFGLSAVFSGGFVAGYTFGRDKWGE